MLGSVLFYFAEMTDIPMLYDSMWTDFIGSLLAAVGLTLVILGFVYLGKSISVGLSRENTLLKTSGIYAVTRNPLYCGGFLLCAGSCFHCIHPANLFFFVLTIIIHHNIILKEEAFLEKKFGERWLEYKRRTPRYLGIRTSN
jgi:protein-S-isoprenylcysteine O-methyltransferase Ste14